MNSFLPWLGGKRRLAGVIAGHLERLPHARYVEPFAGAGHVFFRKSPADGEVLADCNAELMALYRVLQRHVEEFLRHFRWALVSRAEFERQRAARPDTLTDVQRAVRFYYLQKLAFGGRAVEQSFGVDTLHRPRINLLRLEETLSAVHLRLAGGGRCWPAGLRCHYFAATTMISTRNSGRASKAPTQARAGGLAVSTQASHTSFMAEKVRMSER